MNQLININQTVINNEHIKSVSARELHKFLECTERFSSWFERMSQYGFEENLDFIGCKVFNARANQELEDFIISIDMAKEISMLQRSDKGKEARKYFIECEKQLNQHNPQLPMSYKEALLALVAKEEALEEAIKTKAYISDKKTATAMNTASQLSKQLDKAKDYATIKRVESITGVKYNWRELKKSSVANSYPVNDVFDANYGTVKSYHADAWLDVYGVNIEEFK